MTETVTRPSSCPQCGYKFNRAAGAFSDHVPQEGDISLCIRCGCAMIFRADLTVRAATEADFDALPAEVKDQIVRLYQAICALRSRMN